MKIFGVGLLLLFFGESGLYIAQNVKSTSSLIKLTPTVNLEQIAKSKIQISNSEFRIGELAKLDVALLILSRESIYYPSKLSYRIAIKDGRGANTPFQVIYSDDAIGDFELFKNNYLLDTTYMLIGCDTDSMKDYEAKIGDVNKEDPQELFSHGIFSPPANICLDVSRGETYFIQIEVYNDAVRIADEASGNIPTATGRVTSNVFKFHVSSR